MSSPQKRILFITAHRKDRAPNQRFRFEQYFTFLGENGFACVESPLIRNAAEDKIFYAPGSYFKKILLGLTMAFRRWRDVSRRDSFDIIFIAREAFFTGTVFEKLLSRGKSKVIYDFDDSIWLNTISQNNRFFSWLKDGKKTGKIIQRAHLVMAGNDYLADYAKKFNPNVLIIPTTIDTSLFIPARNENNTVVIGWSGSVSTIEHFHYAIPALKILKGKFGDRISIKVVGDGNFRYPELGIQGLPWRIDSELSDLQSFDIGIMPLPDDEWTRGKCGLKGLQYMSLGVPSVMSNVGVNGKIVQDGVNGFLASTTEDWVEKISRLIDNPALRIQMGKAARETVVKDWSVESQRNRYLDAIQSVVRS